MFSSFASCTEGSINLTIQNHKYELQNSYKSHEKLSANKRSEFGDAVGPTSSKMSCGNHGNI